MIKKTLLFIWLLPATILVWLFYIFPLLATKNIRKIGKGDVFIWNFVLTGKSSRWAAKWQSWAGWGGPCVIIYRDDVINGSLTFFARVSAHEERHCQQQFWLSVFFYVAYAANTVFIYFFQKERHPYHDNWFERDARRHAGQRVDVPRAEWMHGPSDRIPWW